MVQRTNYAVYIVDGNFPRRRDEIAEPLGIELASEIYKKEISYGKIVIVTADNNIAEKATQLGIKTYQKTLITSLFIILYD